MRNKAKGGYAATKAGVQAKRDGAGLGCSTTNRQLSTAPPQPRLSRKTLPTSATSQPPFPPSCAHLLLPQESTYSAVRVCVCPTATQQQQQQPANRFNGKTSGSESARSCRRTSWARSDEGLTPAGRGRRTEGSS